MITTHNQRGVLSLLKSSYNKDIDKSKQPLD